MARKTICDACRRFEIDCLWTERVASGNRYVLCGSCRRSWRTCGHEIRHVDEDYPDPDAEPVTRELSKADR